MCTPHASSAAGFQRLAEHLAKGVDVRLGQKVTRVEAPTSSTARVLITAVDGKGAATVYSAKRVIVALPLGVLKAGAVTFSPPLPAVNTAALGRLGSGLLNKARGKGLG